MRPGRVDGIMTATVAVDHVSTTGESSKVGRVIIGQIHGSDDEPCRLYYRKLPGNTNGSIYIAHEPITSAEQWYEMIGSRSSSASNPSDGIALGEQFSYEIKVEGNTLTVTIMRPGKSDVQQIVDMSASGFEDDWMYFKAGVYNQNNSGDPGDYAQVSFFALDVSHGPEGMVLSSENPFGSQDTAISTYPNPMKSQGIISYELKHTAHVNLAIYSATGQKIVELLDESQNQGSQHVEWIPNANLKNGLYFAKLNIGQTSKNLAIGA